MHVEIDSAGKLVAVIKIKRSYGFVPHGGVGNAAEFDMKEVGCGIEDTLLDFGVGKVRAHGLGIEIEGGAAIEFQPVAGVGVSEFSKVGPLLLHEGD
jgi:hypothetical protein